MTTRLSLAAMTARHSDHLLSFAPVMDPTSPECIALERRAAELEAIFAANMARRDAAASEYGEPETPHEFYAGRPGSQAEKIVLDCLRALQAIPEIDRLGADVLMDVIARDYLATAMDAKTNMRRGAALLQIAGKKA